MNTMTTTEGASTTRWKTSAMDLMSMLTDRDVPEGAMTKFDCPPPILLRDGAGVEEDAVDARRSSMLDEMALLRSLLSNVDPSTTSSYTTTASERRSRPLRLEPGSVPMLVMYTGGYRHEYVDQYRICAERTASFHTCHDGGKKMGEHYDQVPVLMVPTTGSGRDDVRASTRLIYEWYDEMVA